MIELVDGRRIVSGISPTLYGRLIWLQEPDGTERRIDVAEAIALAATLAATDGVDVPR